VSGKIQKFKLQKMVLEEKSLGTGWTGFYLRPRVLLERDHFEMSILLLIG
jgi:hypothetical protein